MDCHAPSASPTTRGTTEFEGQREVRHDRPGTPTPSFMLGTLRTSLPTTLRPRSGCVHSDSSRSVLTPDRALSHPVNTVDGMDRTLFDEQYLAARDLAKRLATFDPDCYSDEELVQIEEEFSEFQLFAAAHSIKTAARRPTGEKERSERLSRWLVCQQH